MVPSVMVPSFEAQPIVCAEDKFAQLAEFVIRLADVTKSLTLDYA